MERNPIVSVVIPALHEPRLWKQIQEVESTGAEILVQSEVGYGRAVREGIRRARGQWVTIMTADGSDSVRDLDPMVRVAMRTGVTAVFGDRSSRPATYPRLKWLLNRLGNLAASAYVGQAYSDWTNPFKLYRTDIAKALAEECEAEGMAFGFELALRARYLNRLVVPTKHWKDRSAGKSKFSLGQLFDYLKVLARLPFMSVWEEVPDVRKVRLGEEK